MHRNFCQIVNTSSIMLSFTFFFSKSTLFIHPRAPNTIHFHLYITMCLHDLSIVLRKNFCHDLIPNPRSNWIEGSSFKILDPRPIRSNWNLHFGFLSSFHDLYIACLVPLKLPALSNTENKIHVNNYKCIAPAYCDYVIHQNGCKWPCMAVVYQ